MQCLQEKSGAFVVGTVSLDDTGRVITSARCCSVGGGRREICIFQYMYIYIYMYLYDDGKRDVHEKRVESSSPRDAAA